MVKDNTKLWTEILQKYRGLWVALNESEETVVASGQKAKTAYNTALKKGVKIPILFRVPTDFVPYVGSFI